MRAEVNIYFDDGTLASHDTIYDLLSPYDAVYPIGGIVLEGGLYRMGGWKWTAQISSIKKVEEPNATSK